MTMTTMITLITLMSEDPDDLDVSGNTWEVKIVAPARAVFRPSGFFLKYFC